MDIPRFIIMVMSGLYGAILGSFANAAAYRIPIEKTLWGRSECPKCNATIAWYDNIPIFSWFALKGKCRNCGCKIPFRYAATEIIVSLLFVLIAWKYPLPIAIAHMSFVALMSIGFLTDVDHKILPNRITFGGIFLGLIFSCFIPQLQGMSHNFLGLQESIKACLMSAGFLVLVSLFAEAILKKEAMGLGDVVLAGAFGAFYGPEVGLGCLFSGSLVMLAFLGLSSLIKKENKMEFGKEVPFGPALMIGVMIHEHLIKSFISEQIFFAKQIFYQ